MSLADTDRRRSTSSVRLAVVVIRTRAMSFDIPREQYASIGWLAPPDGDVFTTTLP